MIGLIMAGGKGTRMQLDDEEKLLLNYKKKPVIMHVVDALQNSNCFTNIIALTSPNSPKTEKILKESGIEIVSSSGHNLVSDMNEMLIQLDDFVFVTTGDLPLLDSEVVKKIVERSHTDEIWNSVVTTGSFQKFLGTSIGSTIRDSDIENNPNNVFIQTGINIVNATKITDLEPIKEFRLIFDDKRIGLNLNTKTDFELLSSL
tara:strand:+ start:687 stop:1295 length:609 start_codon:yes stop_codon:yes gene_type:complete